MKTKLFQSLFAKIMLIVMERALVKIPNVIVYLDGIHLLIVRVSTASKLSVNKIEGTPILKLAMVKR